MPWWAISYCPSVSVRPGAMSTLGMGVLQVGEGGGRSTRCRCRCRPGRWLPGREAGRRGEPRPEGRCGHRCIGCTSWVWEPEKVPVPVPASCSCRVHLVVKGPVTACALAVERHGWMGVEVDPGGGVVGDRVGVGGGDGVGDRGE